MAVTRKWAPAPWIHLSAPSSPICSRDFWLFPAGPKALSVPAHRKLAPMGHLALQCHLFHGFRSLRPAICRCHVVLRWHSRVAWQTSPPSAGSLRTRRTAVVCSAVCCGGKSMCGFRYIIMCQLTQCTCTTCSTFPCTTCSNSTTCRL